MIKDALLQVRKHRASKGALRPVVDVVDDVDVRQVRKHRAPKGALRQDKRNLDDVTVLDESESTERHKVH